MSDRIEVELSGNLLAALGRLGKAAVDATPAMGEIARLLVSEIDESFRTESAPDGTKWTPSLRVAGYTAADGTKVEGDGGQTLTLSGDLRRSMRENYGADFAEAGPEASGGAAIYARIHQEGGKIVPKTLISGETHLRALNTPFGLRASVTIPARPYLGWTPVIEGEAIRIIADHIGEELAGAAA